MAAPTWAWAGAAVASTTNASPAYPAAGVTADDAIFAVVASKADAGTGEPPTPATPSGWTLVLALWGGTGTAGAGTGPVKVTVFRKNADADGTENGTTLTNLVANPAGSSLVHVSLFGVRRATAGSTFQLASSSGSDTTAGASFSVTAAADPGITLDDLVLAFAGWDVATASSGSAETISATGATIGTVTERADGSTTAGFDLRRVIWSAACTAGTSSAAPVITATSAASVTGVGVVLRVRELASTAVGKDNQLVWDIRAAIGDPSQLVWDTRAAVGDPGQLAWDVRAAVGDPLQAVWDVRGPVGDPLQAVWDVRAALGDPLELRWDVLSSLAAIGKDLGLVWNLLAALGDPLQLVWDARQGVGDPLQLVWDVSVPPNVFSSLYDQHAGAIEHHPVAVPGGVT